MYKYKVGIYFFGNFAYTGYGCTIQIVVVLTCLDEKVILNITLHLLTRSYKVVVSTFSFIITLRSRCIYSKKGIRKVLPAAIKNKIKLNLRGTQDPNLSGYSEIKSSLIRSFSGPRIITGRV